MGPPLPGHFFFNIFPDIQGYGMTLVTPDNYVDTRAPPHPPNPNTLHYGAIVFRKSENIVHLPFSAS